MAAKYHKYVFDAENRKFVGDFEQMYQDEEREGFDSWHQSDQNHITKQLALSLLENLSYRTAVDVGCGTGGFTHRLKRIDSQILGIDISPTAILKAEARYPHVDWAVGEVRDVPELLAKKKWRRVDLLVLMEILSYVEDWRVALAEASKRSDYILVSLYIPENPIGFVKSRRELLEELHRCFRPIHQLSVFREREETLIWLGCNKEVGSSNEK